MLTFDNVSFNYANQEVFSDINFSLENGELSFLIGKSGSGKSTLLQLIYMNIMPDSGSVQVGEYNSKTIKPKQLPKLRRKLGIIFQDFRLLTDRNIYDNLSFVLQSVSTPSGEIKKKVNDALSDVGLIHRRYSMPDELSGGEKQRVAIARAIVNEPMLILADEPTGNLDPETSMEIMNILTKINGRGTAVLFATHNYELVKKGNAKILKIENGKVLKAVLKQKENA
ncbi:MAG: ATP-binding cassette domain-containing protein [Ignavibacteriales bacterium]|nr:MAG: ATP-binding cassette domain-containing protein [Ignavibacteriales bacterium]